MNYSILFITLYYVALTIVVLSDRKKTSADNYLIAERKLGVWETVSTLFSTYRNASGFVALVTLGVVFGLGALWLTAGMLLALLYFYFILPKIRKLVDKQKLLTMPDYYFAVYGKWSALLSAILIVVMGLIFVVAQFYVGGNVLINLLSVSFPVAVLLIGIPIGIYLGFRGYRSVVRTDIFQWLIILLFLIIPFTLIGSSDLNIEFASLLKPTWMGILGFVVSGFFVTLMGADTWQRLYSAKNVKTARSALIITGPLFFLFNAIIVFFGIMLGSVVGDVSPNQVFYVGFQNVLSPLMAGLLLTILFASIMSTIDSYVFINSLTFVKNIILKSDATEKNIAKTTKIIVLIYLAVAMILALFVGSFLNLVFGATTILTIMAPSAVYSFYKFKGYKLKDAAVVFSVVLGTIVYLPIFLKWEIFGWSVFEQGFVTPVNLIWPLLAAFIGLLIGVSRTKKSD